MRKNLIWLVVGIGIVVIFIIAAAQVLTKNSEKDSRIPHFATNSQFFDAIKELDNEFANDERVIEMFTSMEPEISQLFINGQDQYIVAWNNFGFTCSLIIFINDGQSFKPIYMTKPGRDITGVKAIDLGLDTNFIEITSYFGTAGTSEQRTKILAMENNQVYESWDYMTAISDSTRGEYKDFIKYAIINSVFETPRIYLNENDKKEIVYLWDTQQKKFIEQ